jgi:hypothetical protein
MSLPGPLRSLAGSNVSHMKRINVVDALSPNENGFEFTSHLPERGRPEIAEPACAGASCSSCCCCLHTVGGLVGALVFSLKEISNLKPLNQEELDFQEHIVRGEGLSQPPVVPVPTDGMSVSGIYWRTLLILTLAGLFYGTLIVEEVYKDRNLTRAALFALFFTIMVFPGVQLLSGLITLIILAFNGRGGKPTNEFRHLLRINLGMFAGAIIGFVVMYSIYQIF